MRVTTSYLSMRRLHKLLASPTVTVAFQQSTFVPAHLSAHANEFRQRCFSVQSAAGDTTIRRPSDARWWGGDSGDLVTLKALVQHANRETHLKRKNQASPGPSDKVSSQSSTPSAPCPG